MQTQLIALLPLLVPAALFLYSLWSIYPQARSSKSSSLLIHVLGWFGVIVSLAAAVVLFQLGTLHSATLGWQGLGFSLRLDSLSITMFAMINILALVILRFSNTYLDGDQRKSIFLARMATTIASVQLLVLSGNLFQLVVFWIITSMCMHYLLIFYRNRPQAIAAARKKFIVARLGDISLFIGAAIIYFHLGTADLNEVFAQVINNGGLSSTLTTATIFFVLAAILKSAQFPTHGWLIEVVETPTPVSALLHAGLLNAGPFLMVRMAFLINESTPASILLIAIGGVTAAFASVVFLTQPSVKVGLGYSSIAHMGFSLLICGFGVYSAALLHVVAHSFYKAHAFLSSGSVIDQVRARKVPTPRRQGHMSNLFLSLIAAFAVFGTFSYLWGIDPSKDFSLMATGMVIVLGLSQIFVTVLDANTNFKAVWRAAALTFFVTASFFTLEHAFGVLLSTQLPISSNHSMAVKLAISMVISSYFVVVMIQMISPALKANQQAFKWGIHLRNGFYVNVVFDRWIGSLKNEKFRWVNLTIKEEDKTIVEELFQEQDQPKAQGKLVNN